MREFKYTLHFFLSKSELFFMFWPKIPKYDITQGWRNVKVAYKQNSHRKIFFYFLLEEQKEFQNMVHLEF